MNSSSIATSYKLWSAVYLGILEFFHGHEGQTIWPVFDFNFLKMVVTKYLLKMAKIFSMYLEGIHILW